MTNLIGNYQYSIDDKGRLTIPSKFRDELGDKVILSWNFEKTIVVRTLANFEILRNKLQVMDQFDVLVRNLKRQILGYSYEVEFDKQGRLLLPENLVKLISIKKNVQIVGTGNEIEIFSSENWNEFIDSNLKPDAFKKIKN